MNSQKGALMFCGRIPAGANQFSWKYDGVDVHENIRRIHNRSTTVESHLHPDSLEAVEMVLENLREKAEDSANRLGILNVELDNASKGLESAQKIYTEKSEKTDGALEISKKDEYAFKELETRVKKMRVERDKDIVERKKAIAIEAFEAHMASLDIELANIC